MVHRAGLNADILTDGEIAVGDPVAECDGRPGQGRLRPGRAGHPRARRDHREDGVRLRRGGRRRRLAHRLPRDVRARLPLKPLGPGTSPNGRATTRRPLLQVRAAIASSSRAPPRERIASIARENRRLARRRRERARAPGTIYNALLLYAPDGSLALHHRKLMPTNHERMVWGLGTGKGLPRSLTSDRQGGRPDLLGEHDAARGSPSTTPGVEIYLAPTADDTEDLATESIRPHRPRGACVRRQPRPSTSAPRATPRFRAPRSPDGPDLLGRGGSRDRRARRRLPGRPAVGRGGHPLRGARSGSSCTPSGNASIRPATTTGRTSSRSKCASRFPERGLPAE